MVGFGIGAIIPPEMGDPPHFYRVKKDNGEIGFVYMTQDGRLVPADEYDGRDGLFGMQSIFD